MARLGSAAGRCGHVVVDVTELDGAHKLRSTIFRVASASDDMAPSSGRKRWEAVRALQLSQDLGPAWAAAADTLRQDDSYDAQLTAWDQNRLQSVRARLQRELDGLSNP